MDESRRNQPASHRWKRIRQWFSLCLYGSLLGIIALCILFIYLRTQALPAAYIPQTSVILDVHGQVIDTFYAGQNRQVVDLEQIAPSLIEATLAIEDHRFYDHFGIDLYGLARAIWVDLKHMAKVEGASTITQQLARNLYLSHEKSWSRKLKEARYALQLEMKYSKKEILEKYLNQIYYGHSTYGVQAAAQLFFHKNASELTLAESALLAGVPKGPRYYSPYYNLENAKQRQKVVLQAMVNHGYITQQEADLAANEPLQIMPLEKDEPAKAPYFRDYVRQEVMEKLGLDEHAFNEGGLKIYTTLDLRMQTIAEEVVAQHLQNTELQVALIAMDPRNGYVKAMVGGRDYLSNQYNRVFASTRQPGSSFKPIVYLTALQDPQFTAVTQYKSEPTVFTYDNGKKTYMPSNYNQQYAHDFIDLRQAMKKSDNIFAVHTIMHVGADQVIEMARKLGITSPMEPVPSLALGTYPVSPFEMASAFATIANQGIYISPTSIVRIEDNKGKILYEHRPQTVRAVDPASTYVLTHLMESVFEQGGTGNRVAAMIKRPVAGKTGTTNADSWMVGFTPELSTAVWVGHDRDRAISPAESVLAAPIFAEFTERSLASVPPKLFPIPDGVVSVYIDEKTGKIATIDCPDIRLEYFVKGSEPVEFCPDHQIMADLEHVEDWEPIPPMEEKNRSWWQDLKRWWHGE